MHHHLKGTRNVKGRVLSFCNRGQPLTLDNPSVSHLELTLFL